MPRGKGPYALLWIAVDEAARVKRVGHGADFVLDFEQFLAAVDVDDVHDPVLVGISLFSDQPAFEQFRVRSREVGDLDLDVMAIVFC